MSPSAPSTGRGPRHPHPGSRCRPAPDSGLDKRVDDAVFAGRGDVVDGTGQGRRDPQQPAGRVGELHVHPVSLVLPGVKGPAHGNSVDRQERTVQVDVGLHRRGADGVSQTGGESGQEVDGFRDVAVCGRGPNAESGRELGIRVACP